MQHMVAVASGVRTEQLFESYARQVYSFCLYRLGDRQEAEDAVQSTFLNAFRGLERGVVPYAEAAWLFKIAQNVAAAARSPSAASRRRRHRARPCGASTDSVASPVRTSGRAIACGVEASLRAIASELGLSQSASSCCTARSLAARVAGLRTTRRRRPPRC